MHRRQVLKPGIAAVAAVLLLANGPTWAVDSISPITVLIAYHSVSGNTAKMAQGVSEGVKAVSGTKVILKKVGEVATDDLLSSDAVIVGSPVYVGNMSGEVKTFFDNWGRKFGIGTATGKMRNKIGGAFVTGGGVSSGKEVAILTMLGAMLVHQMIVISGGGAFGASATTGPDSPGIDDKELAAGRDLGKRIAEIASVIKRGSAK